MINGGYDYGYKECECFWGLKPGSLIKRLESTIQDYSSLNILDLGAGEGKNSIYFARKGAKVKAVEISKDAIKNGEKLWNSDNLEWINKNINELEVQSNIYDVVISYGLAHCMKSQKEVDNLIELMKRTLKKEGIAIFCSFNDGSHDLAGHPKTFNPLLLSNEYYNNKFKDFEIIYSSDKLLFEKHPHNDIEHHHSLTRIIAKK